MKLSARSASPELKALEEKASAAARDKETAIRAQDYEKAARLRDAEESFRTQAAAERKKQAREAEKTAVRVTAEDIAAVVSNWTGIPVTRLNESESARLLTLEETLHARVVGQEDAVRAVARAIRRGASASRIRNGLSGRSSSSVPRAWARRSSVKRSPRRYLAARTR